MSQPKRMNVYLKCINSELDAELYEDIPEGEIVYVAPSEEYSFNGSYLEKVIERFNKDKFIGLIYSDLHVYVYENYYNVFLNDDNRIDERIPLFIVKRSDIDISKCVTTLDVFNTYITHGQRVEHLAVPISMCSELAYDNKIHQGN